ncbi:MAG: tetratricopeptide repeat protein [Burkholderiales bacterium]
MKILTDMIKGVGGEGGVLQIEDKPPREAPAEDARAVQPLQRSGWDWRLWGLLSAVALLSIAGAFYYLRQASEPVHPAQHPAAPTPALPPSLQEAPKKAPEKTEVSEAKPPEKPDQQEQVVNSVKIEKSQARTVVNPLSVRGYEAMMARDLAGARQDYMALLSKDPQNREALLGLASVALKRGRISLAERYYNRVLEIDPEDPVATASLVDIRNPDGAESRLKSLLRNSPNSGVLYFSLGNRYASQSLWADAQQAYFNAFESEPGNPDYAFNLAVSLDHLSRIEPALEYYRMALKLSGKGFPGFDPAVAADRIRELENGHAGRAQ